MANDLPRRMIFAAIVARAAKTTPFRHLDPATDKGLCRRGAAMGLTQRQTRSVIDTAFKRGTRSGARDG